MICPYPATSCRCGDRLIHQNNRQGDESSSAFGQHLFDDHPHNFYAPDIDQVIYKRATKIMRVCEVKPLGGEVSGSQRCILPLLANGLDYLVKSRIVSPHSGVFVVWSDPPFETGTVARVAPNISYETGESVVLDRPRFDEFKRGLPVTSTTTTNRNEAA